MFKSNFVFLRVFNALIYFVLNFSHSLSFLIKDLNDFVDTAQILFIELPTKEARSLCAHPMKINSLIF